MNAVLQCLTGTNVTFLDRSGPRFRAAYRSSHDIRIRYRLCIPVDVIDFECTVSRSQADYRMLFKVPTLRLGLATGIVVGTRSRNGTNAHFLRLSLLQLRTMDAQI